MADRLHRNGGDVPLRRDDSRVILHFDYDCFYASVFEAENPALKSLPLAVQQKQIVVTCNYEARRRGLRKLQLIKEAKKVCPDVVIVPGEDLTKFRDASKEIYMFLKGFVGVGKGWGGRVERLGFDEVFLDVTSLIDYNVELLNYNDLGSSFFHLDKTDPTLGFAYDARTVSGPTYPRSQTPHHQDTDGSAPCATSYSTTAGAFPSKTNNTHISINAQNKTLYQRLILGSHLASYIRHKLEQHKSFTATVGISTSKLLAKLAGNFHKPRNQTTLLPPYSVANNDSNNSKTNTAATDDASESGQEAQGSNITRFLDDHDISAVPGIGFKIAEKLRAHVLGRKPLGSGIYDLLPSDDRVTVRDVRLYPNMGPPLLDEILLSCNSSSSGGSGSSLPRDIGPKIWGLINGVDRSPVAEARDVPTQISIEDSYGHGQLAGLDVVRKELLALARSLVRRMLVDLTEEDEEEDGDCDGGGGGGDVHVDIQSTDLHRKGKKKVKKRWLAHPRTLRLSTQTRSPPLPGGSVDFSAGRVSKSCPMPSFIFSLLKLNGHTQDDGNGTDNVTLDTATERLVNETLFPLFRRLHPEKDVRGLNIRVVNVAVTNMGMVGGLGAERGSVGRDIGKMFRSQERVLKEWRVEDDGGKGGWVADVGVGASAIDDEGGSGDEWDSDEDEEVMLDVSGDVLVDECAICGALIPHFAIKAHEVYHTTSD
ncbi:hypothetical protein PAAG_02648 [Paracoccidioides lutzii Pb01]|uniref:UmuC domain-containing protein n=1 Tax=Paracoccidioides lutzii (strain ATCC MYA-826 / Pb01) TaxID=502779 RepID=C1GVV3_PARBA|nr:hypothetical protein PAAG_02648 [Paracoccidioides lutzii Pb01]EEH40672.1 hypothetical protein PAAG_02648 [Paracoccidioides lutzii Pb01]